MSTAFEMITTRQSWYAGPAVPNYYAVQIHTDGKFVKATGTRPFVGICEYAAADADDMVTVVKGSYPAIASENVAAGDLLTITAPATQDASLSDVSFTIAGNLR